ncbi:MAG: class I SAM-dependent methyltransferase [Thermoleophilia bacterium]|nr:class I SAM-dependent methyltransferase [Thermoleophilia bacterium]
MRLRQSGMPEEFYWESLFDVNGLLDRLGIDAGLGDVVELGCGYGTFSLPVARRITGVLRTFDIDGSMVARTRARATEEGVLNLACELRDAFEQGFGVLAGSQDACLLFNILHCEEPERLLREAFRVLRPGGRLFVVHWRHDPATPRGPSLDVRPRPEQCAAWAATAGFQQCPPGVFDLPPFHFGMVFRARSEPRLRTPHRAGQCGPELRF